MERKTSPPSTTLPHFEKVHGNYLVTYFLKKIVNINLGQVDIAHDGRDDHGRRVEDGERGHNVARRRHRVQEVVVGAAHRTRVVLQAIEILILSQTDAWTNQQKNTSIMIYTRILEPRPSLSCSCRGLFWGFWPLLGASSPFIELGICPDIWEVIMIFHRNLYL